jgi:hypothetical protein
MTRRDSLLGCFPGVRPGPGRGLGLGLGLGLLLAAAAGCSSGPSEGWIDFRVSGGFSGGGDGTSIHIEPDGTATRTSLAEGTVTEHLDAATLADLQTRIHEVQFPALAPTYGCLGCADEYFYQVAVVLDGTTYKVSVDSSQSGGQPAELQAVVDALKQLAHSH